MTGPARHTRRDLWLPVLVAAVGCALALVGWSSLIQGRRARLMHTSEEIARDSRRAIERRVESYVAALRDLASLWIRFGHRPDEEWRADADMLIQSYPSLRDLTWVDAEGVLHQILAPEGRTRSEAAKRRAPELAPRIEGPEWDASGTPELRVVLPVQRHGGAERGVLEARIDVAHLLAEVLRGTSHGYAVQVLWGPHTLFARDEPTSDPLRAWWRVEGDASLPFGASWRVVHRPTDELADAQLSPVPHYLLAGGIALSVVLGVLAHQLRLTGRQASSLAESNRALRGSARDLRALNENLEARVAARTSELEDAVAELETFNAFVSHDLRSPLGAILNFSAILQEDYGDRVLDVDGRELVARIQRSANRGILLLQDLLRLSQAGRAPLQLEEVDMAALARESFALARAAEGEPDVEFVTGPLPPVRGDRALLGDLLQNLFGNALKYSRGREKRRISVEGRVEGRECVYEVADNGQGFDMRFADKLFGIFERLHDGDVVEGTGIGLAMVARIVKRHGGRVFAEGQVDRGARFIFTLPWARGGS